MESSARRRLGSISRHLLPQELAAQPSPLSRSPARAAEPTSIVPSPVIIGGMVLDIHAKTHHSHLIPGTTTPGTVQYVSGGVARNIAECMSKLGSKPFMISVLGDDMAGDLLMKYWESAGLPTEGILKLQSITTPVVSIVFDRNGELAAAVASVEAVEKFLTPGWIEKNRYNICSGPILMLDANLHPQSLEVACRIAAESGIPVWFEPVSVAKSTRIASVINYVTCTSPNEHELIAMANALFPSRDFSSTGCVATKGKEQTVEHLFQMLKGAMHVLLDKGIKLLVVTLGTDGVFLCFREGLDFTKYLVMKNITSTFGSQLYDLISELCSKEYSSHLKSVVSCSHSYAFHFPAVSASVVNVTGAGDCLVGGILASICSGLDVMQSTAVGIAVAKAAVECESNIPGGYSLAVLANEAQRVFSAAKPFLLD